MHVRIIVFKAFMNNILERNHFLNAECNVLITFQSKFWTLKVPNVQYLRKCYEGGYPARTAFLSPPVIFFRRPKSKCREFCLRWMAVLRLWFVIEIYLFWDRAHFVQFKLLDPWKGVKPQRIIFVIVQPKRSQIILREFSQILESRSYRNGFGYKDCCMVKTERLEIRTFSFIFKVYIL